MSISRSVKNLFVSTVVLCFPDFNKPFYLQSNSSGYALGVVCYQLDYEGELNVLGFASRILHRPELSCIVTEKELLAIIFGLKKFCQFLLEHKLIIRTDHHALKFLGQCKLLSDRLTKWVMYMNGFDYTVEHFRGRNKGEG